MQGVGPPASHAPSAALPSQCRCGSLALQSSPRIVSRHMASRQRITLEKATAEVLALPCALYGVPNATKNCAVPSRHFGRLRCLRAPDWAAPFGRAPQQTAWEKGDPEGAGCIGSPGRRFALWSPRLLPASWRHLRGDLTPLLPTSDVLLMIHRPSSHRKRGRPTHSPAHDLKRPPAHSLVARWPGRRVDEGHHGADAPHRTCRGKCGGTVAPWEPQARATTADKNAVPQPMRCSSIAGSSTYSLHVSSFKRRWSRPQEAQSTFSRHESSFPSRWFRRWRDFVDMCAASHTGSNTARFTPWVVPSTRSKLDS